MKKTIIAVLAIYLLILINTIRIDALAVYDISNEHTEFETLILNKGALITNWDEEYRDHYFNMLNETPFWGWVIVFAIENVACTFVAEIFENSINNSETTIKKEYKTSTKSTYKTSFKVDGSLGIKGNAKNGTKTLDGGLDAAVKLSYEDTKQYEVTTSETTSFSVPPYTSYTIRRTGSGTLSNGVARKHQVWFVTDKGAFEYFKIGSSTLSINLNTI